MRILANIIFKYSAKTVIGSTRTTAQHRQLAVRKIAENTHDNDTAANAESKARDVQYTHRV